MTIRGVDTRRTGTRTLLAVVISIAALADAQAGDLKQISKKREGNCEYPAWSPDGKGVAYERVFIADRKIEVNLVANVNKPKEVRLQPQMKAKGPSAADAFLGDNKKAKPGDVCRDFSWGPKEDPSNYVFACNVQGRSYQLFYGKEAVQLTNSDQASGQPNFMHDGWGLTFLTSKKGKEGIFVIKDLLDSLDPERLLNPSERVDRMPVWSPNGKKIALVGHDKNSADIYVVNELSDPNGSLKRITTWRGDELNPSWSPDGKKIAFFGNPNAHKLTTTTNTENRDERRGTGDAIYVVDLEKGGKPFVVVKDVVVSEKRGPAWTPDSNWLVYVKDRQKGKLVDPVRAARAVPDAEEVKLKTGTVSNRAPHVVERNGKWWATFSAQGLYKKGSHTWRKIYIFELDAIQSAK